MSSLKLFNKYAESLIPIIEGKELEMINLISKHLESKNRKLKDTASTILVKFCSQISLFISENSSKIYYKELLNVLLRRLKNMILQVEDPNVLITCIQSYGSLGKAVKTLHGDKRLHECLHFLIENTEATLFTKLDRFENFDFEKNPQNFKAVLFNQKQLISYLRSLSFIIVETTGLENYEVNFILKIIKISIKYLTNYFPPYVKNLCESFSLFLNALPIMNYNKIIFRLHVTTIIESMQQHCDVLQLSCEQLFRDFYEKVISDKLSYDKQSISLEQFLNILFNLVDKPEVKSIDVYSMLRIAESTTEKQFYFIVMLFVEIMQKEHFVGLLASQGKAALNLYCIAETKLIANPKNFLMLRLITGLLGVPEVRQHINYSQETLSSFKDLVDLMENTKNDYKDFANVYQEFIVTAFKILKNEFMVQNYKRFLMGVFASAIESNILAIEIVTSVRYYLSTPGSLDDDEKKQLLGYLLKFASKFTTSFSEEDIRNSKRKFVLYLDDDSISSEQIFNKILDVVKLFQIENQEEPTLARDESSAIEACTLLSQKYLLESATFSFNSESLYVYIVNDIMDKKEILSDSAVSRLLYLVGKEIYANYKTDLSRATTVDHNKFLLIVKKTLKVLKVSTELNFSGNDEIFELLLLFFSILFTNNLNVKQNIVSIMKQAKKIYISDFEKLNVNNRAFLEIFCVLFRTCISKSHEHELSLLDNQNALQEILDFIKINVYSPYESIQIFNIQIYEIFFNFLIQNLHQSVLLNDFFEIFVSILQTTADQRENCSLTMKKAFEKLFEISLVLTTRLPNSALFDQAKASMLMNICIENVCMKNNSCLLFDKLKTLIKISSLDYLNSSINDYLMLNIGQLTQERIYQFRLHVLSVFTHSDLYIRLESSRQLLTFYKQNCNFKGIQDELKTFFLLLLNFDEMPIVQSLVEDKDIIGYFMTFLFDGSNSVNDKNLKLAIERLSSYLAESESMKAHILPSIITKELKNDLFKNIDELSRNQFHRKLRALYYFLKAFSHEDLRAYFGQTFIQILYANLKDTLLTRHETSLEYNKAKTLFNFMMKLKIIDVAFCYEVIRQDKINDFVKVLHKNIIRFQSMELQAIFTQIIEAVYIEKKLAQFTKFLQSFKELKLPGSFEFVIDVQCFIEDRRFLEKDLDHFFEFLMVLSELKIQITEQNSQQLTTEVIQVMKAGHKFDVFLLLNFLNSINNDRKLALSIMEENSEKIQTQLFKEIPINLSTLPVTSKEFEKFAEFAHNIFSLSAKIARLDFLSLTYFLLSDETSSFNSVFDFDARQFVLHFRLTVDFKKYIIGFIGTVARSNSKDDGIFDYLLNVNTHIVQHFIAGLPSTELLPILESILLEAFVIIESPIDQCTSFEEVNDLLIKKTIFTSLIDACMSELSKSEIVDGVFANVQRKLFWDNKAPGLVTKRLCLIYSQSLSRTPACEARLKVMTTSNTQAGLSLTTKDKLTALLHTFTANSYNLLVTLILKTQTKPATILNFLLFNDANKDKESSLAYTFPDHLAYDFKVLTEFWAENEVFTSLDGNLQDTQTFLEAFDTFNSSDQQMTFNELPASQMVIEQQNTYTQPEARLGLDEERSSVASHNPNTNGFINFANLIRSNTLDRKPNANSQARQFGTPNPKDCHEFVNFSLFSVANAQNRRGDELIMNTERRQQIEDAEARASDSSILFELDDINKHPCMRKFMIFISTMIQRQGEAKTLVSKLLSLIVLKSLNLNMRLFLLKAILNHRKFFMAFKEDFNAEIVKYLALPANGGKGLHYFYRDMCNLFIEWNKDDASFTVKEEEVELYEKAIKNMISKIGDESEPVFHSNLQMFRSMLAIVKEKITIDLEVVFKLLRIEGTDKPSLIWKTAGLYIIECLIDSKNGIFANKLHQSMLPEDPDLREPLFAEPQPARPDDAYNLLVKPFFPSMSGNLRNQRTEKTTAEISAKDNQFKIAAFEKIINSIIGHSSKSFVRILGKVLGKLTSFSNDFFQGEGSNNLLALSILEAYPRMNERLLILLEEILKHNNEFYLSNPCFRKVLLDPQNFNNDKQAMYIAKIILSSLQVGNPALYSEKMFLVNDVFDVLPQIVQTSYFPTIASVVEILTRVVEIDFKTCGSLICVNIQLVWERHARMVASSLRRSFRELCQKCIVRAFEVNFDAVKTAGVFYLWSELTDSAEVYAQSIRQLLPRPKFATATDVLEFLVADGQRIRQALHAFVLYIVCSLKQDTQRIDIEDNGSVEIAKFKQLVQEQLQLPTNYLSQEFSERNFSQWSQSALLRQPLGPSASKEVLKVVAANVVRSESVNFEESENEDFGSQRQETVARNNEPCLQRFNKESINRMPGILLKKYREQNRVQQRVTPNEQSVSQKQSMPSLLIKFAASGEVNIYRLFAMFVTEILKSSTNRDKGVILALVIKIAASLNARKATDAGVWAGFDVLNDLLYFLHKELNIGYFLEPRNLEMLNQLAPSHLTLLINEQFFIRAHEAHDGQLKHKSEVNNHLETFIDLRTFESKSSHFLPLSKKDIASSVTENGNQGQVSNAQSTLTSIVLEKTITSLFAFSYNAELNTFYKPFIIEDRDYDKLITSVSNHTYRDVVRIIESIDDADNQSVLDTLMAKQKQECFASLEKWDQLVELTAHKNDTLVSINNEDKDKGKVHIKSFTRLPLEDQECLMHAFLVDNGYWNTLKENTTSLLSSRTEREYLETNYSRELAFLSLTVIDFDRANYYNELHKDQIKRAISSVQPRYMDKVINRINTYTKVEAFIKYVKENNYLGSDDQTDSFIAGFKIGRHSFNDCKSAQFNFTLNNVLLHLMLEKYKASDCDAINHLIIENHISFATNLTKLNNIEASENRLKNLLKTKKELFNDERLTYKFIKSYTNLRQNSLHVLSDPSKIKSVVQFFNHCRPIITSERLSSKFKLIEALFVANCIKFSTNFNSEAILADDTSSTFNHRQFLSKSQEILKIDKLVSQMTLSKARATESRDAHSSNTNFNGSLIIEESRGADSNSLAFNQELNSSVQRAIEIESSDSRPYNLHEQLSEISQQMLRLLIDRSESDTANFSKLLEVYFKNTCQMLFKSSSSNHKLPFLFKLLKDFPQKSIAIFSRYLEDLNPRTWLDWIPQLVQFMDNAYGNFSQPILERLIAQFPDQTARHLVFYKTLPSLQDLISRNSAILSPYFDLLEEIKLLNDPELSLLEIIGELKMLIESRSFDKFAQQSDLLLQMLVEIKVIKQRQPLSRIQLEFKQSFKPDIRQLAALLLTADSSPETLIPQLSPLLERISANIEKTIRQRYSSGQSHKLQFFSEKLANFTAHYMGRKAVSYFMGANSSRGLPIAAEPNHLKIIDTKANLAVMNSLRKPKKIAFLCSDNKIRHLLFKSGEDLREDQRIMTIFKIFNSLLDKKQLFGSIKSRISCYEVLPIDRNHGLLEWIPHSYSLKHLIESEMHPSDLNQNPAMHQRQSFLSELGPDPVSRHLALYKLDNLPLVQEFEREVEYFQSSLLRRAMIKKLGSAAEFFEKRRQFFSSYALSAQAGYLLGIGDRHLDNILFDEKLDFYQIDFGCSFNYGLHLAIPELVPFRFSPSILNLGLPFEIEGTFKSTYLAAANVFYLNHDVLNDYIEIYLSEPVENWQKLEKRYGLLLNDGTAAHEQGSFTRGHQTLIKRRLEVFNRKLKGDCPKQIMIEELWNSLHKNKPHFKDLLRALDFKDAPRTEKAYENAADKINSSSREVIKMAIDKTLLGRMWTGWMPFV